MLAEAAHVDELADELIGHRVVVVVRLDVVIDVDPGVPPRGELIALGRKWPECRPVQELEQ